MTEFLLVWLIATVAVWATAALLPGVQVRSFGSALLVAALFGLLNFFLGWLFWGVFTIFTLGIALLLGFITRVIIDAILLKLVSAMTDRFNVDGFGWAIIAALCISALTTLGHYGVRMFLGINMS